jgi:predicted nucleotidyltransferase
METNFVQHAVNVAYDQAVATYSKKQVIGAFVYGSQNYGLADEKSDVDVKVLLLPSATDIYMNAKPVSKEGEFQLPAARDVRE